MMELKLFLIYLTFLSMVLFDAQFDNTMEGFTKKDIKSIRLIKIRKDTGNFTRQTLELPLDRKAFQDFVDDLNSTRIIGRTEVNEMFFILITTKKNKEIRLIGQDKILLDKENGVYYKAGFNWTVKYWNKDLSQGGF